MSEEKTCACNTMTDDSGTVEFWSTCEACIRTGAEEGLAPGIVLVRLDECGRVVGDM